MREALVTDATARVPKDVRARDAGFTLIEVLIAFVILSVSLTVLLGTYGMAMKRTALSEARMIAASHARSLLAEAGVTSPIVAGVTSGTFEDGFGWRVEVAPYGSGADAAAWPKGAYAITASVTWGEGGGDRVRTVWIVRGVCGGGQRHQHWHQWRECERCLQGVRYRCRIRLRF